jgi:polyhydroxybutyrate depolymerase
MPLKGIMIIRALTALAFASVPIASLYAHESKTEHITVGDSEREYIVSRTAGRLPRPTILVLHGSLSNAKMAAMGMGFAPLVDREQLVAVYPNAIAGQFNDGHAPSISWGDKPPDDVAFLRVLAAHLVDTGVSDPHRIYVAGFSSGGMMAFRLMCEAPQDFAAIAPIAAALPADVERNCKAKPTPTLMINGTADPLVPFSGRKVSFSGGRLPSNDETVRFVRKVNGCSDKVNLDRLPHIESAESSNVVIASWTDCSSRAPVVLYRIEGGGHRIPSRGEGVPFMDVVLGTLNHDFEATEAIWSFFKDRTR